MRKTKNLSQKLSVDTTASGFQNFHGREAETSPSYARLVSSDGEEHENVFEIKGIWPEDHLYKNHPRSTPFEDFMQELYSEGYEDSIRQGRRELGAFIKDEKQNETLRSIRLMKGFSQDELAQQAGIQQYQISRYESGKEMPSLLTAARICEVLDIDPNTLFNVLGLKT
ncbi:MAG: helix-turn-helix transcriptional regulator [Alphaproteobacteria bacterium]|nr:helix-turn-helix transcriptional regulator [Alphaproteobacteria bacterium]